MIRVPHMARGGPRRFAVVGSLFAALSGLPALQLLGQLPPLIPREVLFGNPDRDLPLVSPDGTKLAYLAPDSGVMNVWVRTIGASDDRAVTRERHRGIQQFIWQEDSDHILYLQDEGGDENWHVFRVDVETEELRDLTPLEDSAASWLGTHPGAPDELLVALNARDPRYHDVHRIQLSTGEMTLEAANPGDVSEWTFDNAYRVRALQAQLPDGGTEIRVRDPDGEVWRVVQRWGPEEAMGWVVGFTPENDRLWLASSVGSNTLRLVEVDLESGATTEIAADEYDLMATLLHPRCRTVDAVQFVGARAEWRPVHDSVANDLAKLRSFRNGDFTVLNRDHADSLWTVSYTFDDRPVEFYLYDRRSGTPKLLFVNRSALEGYRLASMQPISLRARDGLTLQGYLTLPIGEKPRALPTVLLVHGGPWWRDFWGYDGVVQWLANRGYAVLQVNFRGSTGFGKDFLNAGDREWGARMHDDLIDAKRWAVEQGYSDADRVCIFGGSYGGYATLVGLAFTPREFACGVDIVGPSNLVTLLETTPPYWESFRSILNRRIGDLETEREFLESRSPLFRADSIRAPLLIGQGANDPRVKQAESDQIVTAMRDRGLEVEYVVFPDEGHGFNRPENALRFTAAAEAFLTKHLGGRLEPRSAAEAIDEFRR